MTTLQIVLGIILLVAGVFLVVAVLMQSSKDSHLSGSIAGGAETFFGKTKGKTMDKVLNKLTIIVAIMFVALVIVVYVVQPNTTVDPDNYFDKNADLGGDTEASETVADTESETAAETVAETTAETVADTEAESTEETVAETEAETAA